MALFVRKMFVREMLLIAMSCVIFTHAMRDGSEDLSHLDVDLPGGVVVGDEVLSTIDYDGGNGQTLSTGEKGVVKGSAANDRVLVTFPGNKYFHLLASQFRKVEQADSISECSGESWQGIPKIAYKYIPIPKPAEAASFAAGLSNLHPMSHELEDGILEWSNELTGVVDLAARYSLLAYARLDGEPLGYRMLSSKDNTNLDELNRPEIDVIEVQFLAPPLRVGDYKQAAHCVAYLYKLDRGVGVVLTYKGSTNQADWAANLDAAGFSKWDEEAYANDCQKSEGYNDKNVFIHGSSPACAMTHPGFLEYEKGLENIMDKLGFYRFRKYLRGWNFGPEPEDKMQETFKDWLYSKASWSWCAVVGHSLGGAMAAIAATKIGQHAGRPTLLATFGQPVVGNFGFKELAKLNVKPDGGLRFVNRGDLVTHIGFSGKSFILQGPRTWHNGLYVELRDARATPLYAHTRWFVKSDLCQTKEQTEFVFPLSTYKPSAETDFGVKNTMNFHVCQSVKKGHCMQECPTGKGDSFFNTSVLGEAIHKFRCQNKYPKPWNRGKESDSCYYHTGTPDQSCFQACSCLGGMPDVGAMINLENSQRLCKKLAEETGTPDPECEGEEQVDELDNVLEALPTSVKLHEHIGAGKTMWRGMFGSKTAASHRVCACQPMLWDGKM